jgi:hypothetical protein
MKTTTAVTIGCLLLSACAEPQSADVAIRGATIVDLTSGVLIPDQTILIAGRRIAAVGATRDVRIAPGAAVIDAEGGYLIPGLWDMHVHSVRKAAADLEEASVANVDWHFPLFLAFGVTGVRNMNDGTGDVTLEFTNSVKRRLAEGELLGPRLVASGPQVDGDPPLGANPVVVHTAAEARAAVDRLADAGADFIKPYEPLSRGLFRDPGSGAAPGDSCRWPRAFPRDPGGGGRRRSAHGRASGSPRRGLLDRS